MARKRDPRREEAFEIWKKHKGEITNKSIAEQLDVPAKTISAWKSRDKWNAVLQTNERSTTNNNRSTSKVNISDKSTSNNDKQKKETSSNATEKKKVKGRRSRSGNPNPKNQFAERNTAALKHGLFSRYIPKETLELMGSLEKDNPADIIWDQITLQYASIIRAQQIMFVDNKNEVAKELKKLKVESGFDNQGNSIQIPIEQEYEVQFAWDRHATFMNAQSRAIGELRTSIKQFVEMAHDDDERLLKLEQMNVGIDKTKAEIDNLSNGSKNESAEDWVVALKEVAEKRRVNKDE